MTEDTTTEIREAGETAREQFTGAINAIKEQNTALLAALIGLAVVMFLALAVIVVKLLNAKPTNDIERELYTAMLKGLLETLQGPGKTLTNLIPGTVDDRGSESLEKLIEKKLREMALEAPLPIIPPAVEVKG